MDLLESDKDNESDEEKDWSPLSKLCFTRASGNNSTLYDHSSNGGEPTEFIPEEIALNLLTFQNFFVAGGKASSRAWGDDEIKNPPNPKGGPCSGKSIIYTFLRGKFLSESIHLNLNTYEHLKFLYGDLSNRLGRPLWEIPIESPNDISSIENATQTHIGRLVPQTRMLRINEDRKKVLLGPGFLYPKFQDKKNPFFHDLFATTVQKHEEEKILLSARSSSTIWKELHALSVYNRRNDSISSRGPLCLLNIPDASPCDIITNSMITNPKQAAEIIDLIESIFHLPANLRTAKGINTYQYEVKKSESLENLLGGAVEEYRTAIDKGWKQRVREEKDKSALKAKLHSIATTHYWTTVEKNLSLLMTHIRALGTENAIPTRETWRNMLFATACDAYRITCGQETPRQIKAFALGWRKLTMKKDEAEAKTNENDEDDAE